LEESRVFTASTSLANATIYNSMCTATTTAAESTGSIFDHSSLSTPAYVTGSTSATSHSTVTSVDSRASMLADSGSIYRPNAMPSGSLSSHSSLSSGQVYSVFHSIALVWIDLFVISVLNLTTAATAAFGFLYLTAYVWAKLNDTNVFFRLVKECFRQF